VDEKALIEIPGHWTVTQRAEIASIDSMAWTAERHFSMPATTSSGRNQASFAHPILRP
jgi:hypothetical protein